MKGMFIFKIDLLHKCSRRNPWRQGRRLKQGKKMNFARSLMYLWNSPRNIRAEADFDVNRLGGIGDKTDLTV